MTTSLFQLFLTAATRSSPPFFDNRFKTITIKPFVCFRETSRDGKTEIWTDGFKFGWSENGPFNSSAESMCLHFPASSGSWKHSSTGGIKATLGGIMDHVQKCEIVRTLKFSQDIETTLLEYANEFVPESVHNAYSGGN
jgi:hypothetical protein